MNEQDQKDGEKRVREFLIEPVLDAGLARPSTLNVAAFDRMLGNICQRLASVDRTTLESLYEFCIDHPGGKDKDRFPLARDIFAEASKLSPPKADASPLIRKVFSAELGQRAIAEGWSPELLATLRKPPRRWPVPHEVERCLREGKDAHHRLHVLLDRERRGGEWTEEERRWVERRQELIATCRDIAALAAEDAA